MWACGISFTRHALGIGIMTSWSLWWWERWSCIVPSFNVGPTLAHSSFVKRRVLSWVTWLFHGMPTPTHEANLFLWGPLLLNLLFGVLVWEERTILLWVPLISYEDFIQVSWIFQRIGNLVPPVSNVRNFLLFKFIQ